MAAPIWTAEMVRALPDDGRKYETVHGELLVSPAARPWPVIVGRLHAALHEYLRREPVGHVFGSHSDISWSDDTLVQPDLFVVPLEEARTMEWAAMTSLRLAVEVLRPSSQRADRFTKRRLYQEVGIPLYWVIDGEDRSVEVWTPADRFPAVARDLLRWEPPGVREPFVIELRELFAPV